MSVSLKESIVELFTVMKASVTSFWFWLPILYAAGVFIDLWLMINVHPLIGVILPAVLIIYAICLEEKRVKLRYGIKDKKYLKAFHAFGQFPEPDRRLGLIEELAEYAKRKKEKSKSE